MNPRNRLLVRAVLVLAVLWGVVFAVVKLTGSMQPTAEKVLAYREANPLPEIEDPGERREVIGEMADMLNGLEADEVARLAERAEGDPRRAFFREMTPEEQRFFFEKRVGRAFEQMMESFNRMEREERKALVERALSRMREDREETGLARMEERDPELAERMAEAGLEAYYSDASVETKIDLAPLLEEMQRTMSRF